MPNTTTTPHLYTPYFKNGTARISVTTGLTRHDLGVITEVEYNALVVSVKEHNAKLSLSDRDHAYKTIWKNHRTGQWLRISV